MRPEKAPQGTTFIIQDVSEICIAVELGIDGEIANQDLETPFLDLGMKLVANPDRTFDIETVVNYEAYNPPLMKAVEAWVAAMPGASEQDGTWVFKGTCGTELVFCADHDYTTFSLTTGRKSNPHSGEEPRRIVKAPGISDENVDLVLGDAAEALGRIMDYAYTVSGKAVPNQEIVINQPRRDKAEADQASEDRQNRAKRELGKTALGQEPGKEKGQADLIANITIERPNVSFADIGGQENAKREVQGLVSALLNPDVYQRWGTTPPKGILLHGPPGTGKTLLAKALASEAKARFLELRISDIVSKWYGESEQRVSEVFDYASDGKKTIIFIDEADALLAERDGAHEVTARVVGAILQHMDGMRAMPNVMVVAATNRLVAIEEAIRRAGRFDRLVEVPLPDLAGCQHILDIHMDQARNRAGSELFSDVDKAVITKKMSTAGWNGADIAEVVRRVLEEKVRLEVNGQLPGLVTTEELLAQVDAYEHGRKGSKQRPVGIFPNGHPNSPTRS